MKTCNTCKESKDISEFYAQKGNRDGRSGRCKSCAKTAATANRNKNLERVRAYDRKRGNRQPPEYLNKYRSENPNKYKAHNMVNNAIRDGKLFKEPCQICGSTKKIHAHHDDYSKPLNVRFLCSAHHSQWHVENGEGLNP